jgi:hypothetical protein
MFTSTFKVVVPNSVSCHKGIHVFEWCMVGCDVKNGHQKDMFERDYITCSKFVKHSKRNTVVNIIIVETYVTI